MVEDVNLRTLLHSLEYLAISINYYHKVGVPFHRKMRAALLRLHLIIIYFNRSEVTPRRPSPATRWQSCCGSHSFIFGDIIATQAMFSAC